MSEPAVTFRRITRVDFPLIGAWLREPHVARWWANASSPDVLERDYGPVVDGTEPSDVFMIDEAGGPVGLIQRYRIESYPEYLDELAPLLAVPPHAASIDYLLGPPEAVGRGLGTRAISAFTDALWRDWPDVPAAVVPVHAENAASWRALARAGYRRVAEGELEPDNPADSRAHVVYRIDRPAVADTPA